MKFYKRLEKDKIEIRGNKNLIKMDLFLSFLTVKTERQTDFLGSSTGWTRLEGENDLIIKGGKIGGVEYLDKLCYMEKLDNRYNDFVNPFYLFPIMNKAGKVFFLDYYSENISSVNRELREKGNDLMNEANSAIHTAVKCEDFWESLRKENGI